MKSIKTIISILFAIFFLFSSLNLVSAFGTKITDCSYTPQCTTTIQECGICSFQLRETLCAGGCSSWSSCDNFRALNMQPTGLTDGCVDGEYRDYYCTGDSDTPSYEILTGIDTDTDGIDDCSDCDPLDNTKWEELTYYFDADSDGYGSTEFTSCTNGTAPSGYTLNSGDTDDSDDTVYPNAPELCDGKDNNLDSLIDNDLSPVSADNTNGVCSSAKKVCDGTNGWIEPDYSLLPNYESTEISNDYLDNDCDGLVDENNHDPYLSFSFPAYSFIQGSAKIISFGTYFTDADGDDLTYNYTLPAGLLGNYNSVIKQLTIFSNTPNAYVCKVTAKDDFGGMITENFSVEVSSSSSIAYYCDVDNDTYLSSSVSGYASDVGSIPAGCSETSGSDCNDNVASVNYFALEICDAYDNDCDGEINEGLTSGTINPNQFGVCSGSHYTCNENVTDWFIDYSAIEFYEPEEISCDSLDNDCDGLVDEGLKTKYYQDKDDDGYGLTGFYADFCEPTGDYTSLISGDCDDSTALCIDDCVSRVYLDQDSDGVGLVGATSRACDANMTQFANISGDCDDLNPLKSPLLVDICDNIDNNCDGSIDNGWESLTERNSKFNSIQTGVCSGSMQACSDGVWVDWYDLTNIANYEPIEYTQDGLDNDCDGIVDEQILPVNTVEVNEDYPLSGYVIGSFENPVGSETQSILVYGSYYSGQTYTVLDNNNDIFYLGKVNLSGSGTYNFSFSGLDSYSLIDLYFLPDNVSSLSVGVSTRVSGIPEFGHVVDSELSEVFNDDISFEFKDSYGTLLNQTVTKSNYIQTILTGMPENKNISMSMNNLYNAGQLTYSDCSYTNNSIVVVD